MDPRYQIKPQPWPRGINQDDQLVDREYELKPLSEGAINEDSKINTDNNNLQSKLVPEDLAFNEGLNLMNNAVETGQNGGLKSRNPLMMSKSKSIRMPKGVINRADDRTRVDLIESGENHSNEENRMPIRSSEEGRIDYKTESQKLSGSVPKTSDTVLASNNVFETKDILQSERRVNGVGTAKRLKSSRYGNHPANFAVNTGCHGNSKTLVNGHNVVSFVSEFIFRDKIREKKSDFRPCYILLLILFSSYSMHNSKNDDPSQNRSRYRFTLYQVLYPMWNSFYYFRTLKQV